MQKFYTVYKHGFPEFTSYRLINCLRFIGREITGKSYGALLVTAKEAVEAGYSISLV